MRRDDSNEGTEPTKFEVEGPRIELAELAIDLDLPSDEQDFEMSQDGIPAGFERLACGLLVRVGGAA